MLAQSYQGWLNDRAPRLGASLAFYTLLSLAPMIVVVVAVASIIYGERAAQGRLVWEIQGMVGRQGATAIQGLLGSAQAQRGGVIATVTGLTALFFGASAVVVELRDALNTIWKVPARTPRSRWMMMVNMLKERATSFGIVLAIGLLLMASLVVNTWVSMAGA
jgi:membrane protein